jgi:hypothetical protein
MFLTLSEHWNFSMLLEIKFSLFQLEQEFKTNHKDWLITTGSSLWKLYLVGGVLGDTVHRLLHPPYNR